MRESNLPVNEESEILKAFILKNYGGFTAPMFNEAFDLAMAGTLGIEDTNCYQNFSCQYVGKILSAYSVWAKSNGRIKSNLEKEQLAATNYTHQLTGGAKGLLGMGQEDVDWSETLEWTSRKVLTGNKDEKIFPVAMYDWMVRKGMIDDDYTNYIAEAQRKVSGEDSRKKSVVARMRDDFSTALGEVAEKIISVDDVDDRVRQRAKRLAIFYYCMKKQEEDF